MFIFQHSVIKTSVISNVVGPAWSIYARMIYSCLTNIVLMVRNIHSIFVI